MARSSSMHMASSFTLYIFRWEEASVVEYKLLVCQMWTSRYSVDMGLSYLTLVNI